MKRKMELKTCPFCGELPKVTKNMPVKGLLSISCENRKCGVHPHVVEYNRKSAANKWNNRADGWIPVDDRLPNFDEDVLVYLKNDESETTMAVVKRQKFILKGKVTIGWFVTVNAYGSNALEEKYIVAWQPLSKKYVGGAE